MKQSSKSIVTIGGIVSVILAYNALFETGAFDALNEILIWEYTVPQLIWLTLVIVGLAVIVYSIWAGTVSPKDFLKETSSFIQQTGGMTETEANRFMKDIANEAINKLPVKINAVTIRDAKKGSAKPDLLHMRNYPSPAELAQSLWKNYSVFRIMQTSIVKSVSIGNRLRITPARLASSTGVLPLSGYEAKKAKMLKIFIIMTIVACVIAFIYTTYFMKK